MGQGKSNSNQRSRLGIWGIAVAAGMYVSSMFMPAVDGMYSEPYISGYEAAWISFMLPFQAFTEDPIGFLSADFGAGEYAMLFGTAANLSMIVGMAVVWSKRWSLRWFAAGILGLGLLFTSVVPWFSDDGLYIGDGPGPYDGFHFGYFFWMSSFAVGVAGAALRSWQGQKQTDQALSFN